MAILKNTLGDEGFVWSFEDVVPCRNNRLVKSYYHDVGVTLPLHSHDFYELNIIVRGGGKHYIGAGETVASVGDVFVIPRGVSHGYSSVGDLVVFHLLLSERFMNSFYPLFEELDGFKMLFSLEPLLRQRLDRPYFIRATEPLWSEITRFMTELEHTADCKGAEAELKSALSAAGLIALLSGSIGIVRDLGSDDLGEKHALSIIASMEYLEKHFDRPVNVTQLAQRCTMSYGSFLRHFKRLSGKTPSEYVSHIRTQRAEKLLLTTENTILEIALSLGYYDSSHFIRDFIRNKGVTPTEYRFPEK